MFELLATVDPFAALLGSLWLFAAGMFPLGFMLGSTCSACCGAPCSACTQGSLPDTLTVAFSGIPETTPGPDLISLSFSSCFGSGASGRVTAPGQSAVGGDPAEDRGPISGVEVTNGGSGYARLGRVAPTVSVSGTSGSGTGATFSVTLATSKDSCGLDRWAVSKVERTGGTGYQTGDTLTFAIAEGDTQEVAASATIGGTTYAEPTLTATATGGTGGVLSINGYAKLVGGPPFGGYYAVTGITVVSGGSGYTNNSPVTLSLGADDEWAPSSGAPNITIRTQIDPPGDDWTLTAYSADGMDLSAGVGLALSITLTPIEGVDGFFEATAVTITNGGTGYQVGEFIIATVPPDGDFGETALTITDVDQDGAVTGLLIDYPGQHQGVDTGVISSVVINSGRPARKAITEDVSVSNGGVYYREDASLPPYVATVTVGVNQTAPSQGSGASISATVGSDPADAETFGKITGLTIGNGGDGYLAHELFASCLGRFNGRSIVVKRNYPFWYPPNCCPFFPISLSPDACTYGYVCANTGDPCSLEAEAVRVEYHGPSEPMTVFLMLHQRGQTNLPLGGGYYYPAAHGLLTANENVENCSDIDVNAYGSQWLPEEATANVTSGGEYQEYDTCKKISEDDMAALYVDVTCGDITTSGSGSLCGWRSGAFSGNKSEDTTGQWCDSWRATVPARIDARMAGTSGYWANVRNIVSNCSETRNLYGVNFSIGRLSDCSWGWYPGGHLCVSVSRQLSLNWTYDNIYGPVVNPVSGGRTCQWCYPIIGIPVDDNFMPSGDAVLGEPVYSGGSYPWQATAFWFDDLLSEASVCVNPGPPTITFSPLP